MSEIGFFKLERSDNPIFTDYSFCIPFFIKEEMKETRRRNSQSNFSN